MKCVTVLLLSLGFPASCLATTPMPHAIPCGTLDRVSAAAGSPSLSAIALDLLERVAMGRRAGISDEAEKQVGLTPGEFQRPMYSDPTVRACALRSLGKTGLPGAVEFLTNFKRTDAGDDSSQEIWPAAQIAQVAAKWDIGFASEDMRLYDGMTLAWHMAFVQSIDPAGNPAYAQLLRPKSHESRCRWRLGRAARQSTCGCLQGGPQRAIQKFRRLP